MDVLSQGQANRAVLCYCADPILLLRGWRPDLQLNHSTAAGRATALGGSPQFRVEWQRGPGVPACSLRVDAGSFLSVAMRLARANAGCSERTAQPSTRVFNQAGPARLATIDFNSAAAITRFRNQIPSPSPRVRQNWLST
jgi:hypothetical protein